MAKVYRSAVIDAPIDAVWALVRDFNALPNWHPAIATSEIELGLRGDTVGCVRRFTRKSDGGLLREQLLALSDRDYKITYNILVSPMPVANYEATLQFISITHGDRTLAQWWAQFDVTQGPEQDTTTDIGDNVFAVGFAALNARLARRSGGSND